MEVIKIKKDKTFEIPERHNLSKENRRIVIKTEFMTVIQRLLKGDFQEMNDVRMLSKPRRTHKDLIEINGEFFRVLRPLEVCNR